jgi:PAS domain S-box-containing protein
MFKWFKWHDLVEPSKPSAVAAELISKTMDETLLETRELTSRIIKKLENRLEDREELLSNVFNTVKGILCLKDAEGRWKVLNAEGKRTFGLEGSEYKEKTNEEVALLSPRYSQGLINSTKTDEAAWKAGSSICFEDRIVDSFGTEKVYSISKTPIFDQDGNRKYLLAHLIDITEEVENTRHINALVKALDHASDSIVVLDSNFVVIYANKAYLEMCGRSLTEKSGRAPSFLTSLKIDVVNDLKTTGKVWSGEVSSVSKTGELVPGILTITPVLNGKPYPIYYIGVKRVT